MGESGIKQADAVIRWIQSVGALLAREPGLVEWESDED